MDYGRSKKVFSITALFHTIIFLGVSNTVVITSPFDDQAMKVQYNDYSLWDTFSGFAPPITFVHIPNGYPHDTILLQIVPR